MARHIDLELSCFLFEGIKVLLDMQTCILYKIWIGEFSLILLFLFSPISLSFSLQLTCENTIPNK